MAIYAHFEDVERPPGKAGGNIVIIRNADGWAWFIPLDGDRASVGVVVTTESMRASRLRPEALFRRIVSESPKLTAALANARWDTRFHVTADYNYRARAFCGRRLMLVGDAACFLDPMFSTGVFIALLSAKFAAQEVIAAHRNGAALSWWARRRYTRKLGRNLATLERMVLAFYDDASFSVFMERNPPLLMGRGNQRARGGPFRSTLAGALAVLAIPAGVPAATPAANRPGDRSHLETRFRDA